MDNIREITDSIAKKYRENLVISSMTSDSHDTEYIMKFISKSIDDYQQSTLRKYRRSLFIIIYLCFMICYILDNYVVTPVIIAHGYGSIVVYGAAAVTIFLFGIFAVGLMKHAQHSAIAEFTTKVSGLCGRYKDHMQE